MNCRAKEFEFTLSSSERLRSRRCRSRANSRRRSRSQVSDTRTSAFPKPVPASHHLADQLLRGTPKPRLRLVDRRGKLRRSVSLSAATAPAPVSSIVGEVGDVRHRFQILEADLVVGRINSRIHQSLRRTPSTATSAVAGSGPATRIACFSRPTCRLPSTIRNVGADVACSRHSAVPRDRTALASSSTSSAGSSIDPRAVSAASAGPRSRCPSPEPRRARPGSTLQGYRDDRAARSH